MKAILHLKFGPPEALVYGDAPVPAPADEQALVRVRASSVNPADYYRATSGSVFLRLLIGNGILRPKTALIGSDVAGVVEATGKGATAFKPGDEVFGICLGAWAELVTVPERTLVLKPRNVSFEEAAAVPLAALTALQGLSTHGGLQPGQKVLISGASGGVGSYAVQIAKLLGADVTAECSTGKVPLALSLGADRVIDYTKERFAVRGDRYDLILVVNGRHPLRDYRRSLSVDGRCVVIGGSIPQVLRVFLLGRLLGKRYRRRVRGFIMEPNRPDLLRLAGWLEQGRLRSVIDRSYPVADVAQALRLLREGHAFGKIVLTG